jgi:hypothetical protein
MEIRSLLLGLGTPVLAGSADAVLIVALIGNPSQQRLNQSVMVRTLTAADVIIDSGQSNLYHIDGPIVSYSLTTYPVGKTVQEAGVAFELRVSNALDAYNHPATDSVIISALSGALPAPDGTRAILNNIGVNNGSGSQWSVWGSPGFPSLA